MMSTTKKGGGKCHPTFSTALVKFVHIFKLKRQNVQWRASMQDEAFLVCDMDRRNYWSNARSS